MSGTTDRAHNRAIASARQRGDPVLLRRTFVIETSAVLVLPTMAPGSTCAIVSIGHHLLRYPPSL